jgi:hypothetical protein
MRLAHKPYTPTVTMSPASTPAPAETMAKITSKPKPRAIR